MGSHLACTHKGEAQVAERGSNPRSCHDRAWVHSHQVLEAKQQAVHVMIECARLLFGSRNKLNQERQSFYISVYMQADHQPHPD